VPVEPQVIVGVAIVAALVALGFALLAVSRRRVALQSIPLRLTPHAVERMVERGVPEIAVRKALAHPDRVVATTYNDKGHQRQGRGSGGVGRTDQDELDSVRLEKDFRGRTLKVWVPPDWRSETPIAVKSVAWRFVTTLRVAPARVGAIIGRGGQTVRDLQEAFGVVVQVDRRGLVRISGDDRSTVAVARRRIARGLNG